MLRATVRAVGGLRSESSAAFFALENHTLVGRAEHCALRIDDDRVSSEHASVSFRDRKWVLRDLGSTNGTWLNDTPLSPGVEVELTAGARLSFADPSITWVVEDTIEPVPMVVPLAGGIPTAIDEGVIAIPGASDGDASIFRAADGQWALELKDSVMPLRAGSVFEAGGRSWRFTCPAEWKPTMRTGRVRLVADSTFHFSVSADEERVLLTVESRRERVSMGQLSGYYMLLQLARLRNADTRGGEAGWTHREDLMRMLRCGEQQLNVWIHRVRSKFSSMGFLDYAQVVERREGTGQMRIGALECTVEQQAAT